MPTESEVWKSRAPRRLRAGVIIGSAIALIGITVGTATGAVTPFQQVVVVNTPASPIPIVGTVNVGNTPANQNVTVTNPAASPVQVRVTNLPATQPVSGTVSVSNLPAVQNVSKVYSALRGAFDAGSTAEYDFGETINVSTLIINNNGSDDELAVYLDTVDGRVFIYAGEGAYTQNFTMPVPATRATVTCRNLVVSCSVTLSALGS